MDTALYWGGIVALLGLIAGSFAGAQVWRLRWQQLSDEKQRGEAYDASEYRRLRVLDHSSKKSHDRSHCLECGHQLAWYDLIPLFSWLSSRGRCRYCGERIGLYEPTAELLVAAAFLVSYLAWPFGLDSWAGVSLLVLWLTALVPAVILFIYDLKWSLLPDVAMYAFILLGLVFAGVAVAGGEASLLGVVGSLAVFAGLYGGLYYGSAWRYGEENSWVGFGDVKLSIALGLLLLDWQMAFLAIFAANLLGTLLVLPGLLSKKLGRKSQIPFGPMLLIGTFIIILFGDVLLQWYIDSFSL